MIDKPGTAEQSLRYRLFAIASYKGYCTIYSSYDVTMEAMQRVVNEMNLTNIHPKHALKDKKGD